ncbi:MAG: LysR family transcriptional regulator [Blastomonas sp.]
MDPDYPLFVRIVETGSLSSAGRDMHLSPAAVSKRLTRLEERLGARLFQRTTRRLNLTGAGQQFYQDVTAILALAEAAEAKIKGMANVPRGRLTIAAPTSFGRAHVVPHLPGLMEQHPEIELELQLDDEYTDLMASNVDVAVRISAKPPGNFVSRKLAPNLRVLCASPAYLEKHGTPGRLSDLQHHHLLAASHQTPWRLVSNGRSRSVPVLSRVLTNSSDVVRELAIAGSGIALRSTWDISEDIRHGRLVRVLDDWSGTGEVEIHAVYLRTPYVPAAVTAFVEFMARVYSPGPYWDELLPV